MAKLTIIIYYKIEIKFDGNQIDKVQGRITNLINSIITPKRTGEFSETKCVLKN